MTALQGCLLCAWRENCAKRFRVSDGGVRCADFSQDVSMMIRSDEAELNDNKDNIK